MPFKGKFYSSKELQVILDVTRARISQIARYFHWRNTGRRGVYFAQDVEPFLRRRGIDVDALPILEYDSANAPGKIV